MKPIIKIPDSFYGGLGEEMMYNIEFHVNGKRVRPIIKWWRENHREESIAAGENRVERFIVDVRGMGIEQAGDIEGLDGVDRIDELWLDDNHVADLAPFTRMPWAPKLKVLRASNNRIARIPDLSAFGSLESLSLGESIERIEGLDGLKYLKFLRLGSNITKTEGIGK
nr:hypothetical protein [Candidatus Sigynarchaeota archaeon]